MESKLSLLVDLTRFLAAEHTLAEATERVATTALELVPTAERVFVRTLDTFNQELTVELPEPGANGKKPSKYQGAPIARWVIDTGSSAIVADTREDKRLPPTERLEGVRSLLAVPLLSNAAEIGVLTVMSSRVNQFNDADEGALAVLANCVSPMLDRVRLFRRGGPNVVHTLSSPLRLRLVAELLDVGEEGLTLDEAVLCTGRHEQDVAACLLPLVRWHIVEERDGRYRVRPNLERGVLESLHREVKNKSEQLGRERHVRHHLLGGMIGLDAKMQMVFEVVRQVARLDVPVLIHGETGTGKELVARAVHDISPRRNGFFGAINCGAVREALFESELFGHKQGAFAGAANDYVGLVERCDRGTLFLDEVGDLSLDNQAKLLRHLEDGSFSRVGEDEVRRSRFRLIAATNRDLERMVSEGRFRDDLYYRLAVFPIRLPSLRERRSDLRYLVEGIMAVHAQRFQKGDSTPAITADALGHLERYDWPGNVRELEKVILRALMMAGGEPIRPEHLPRVELLSEAPQSGSSAPPDSDEANDTRSLELVQRDHIARVLRVQRGNIKASARILGISRTTLYKKIRDLEIDAPA